jgi:integral membrane sensor domain MASE1
LFPCNFILFVLLHLFFNLFLVIVLLITIFFFFSWFIFFFQSYPLTFNFIWFSIQFWSSFSQQLFSIFFLVLQSSP